MGGDRDEKGRLLPGHSIPGPGRPTDYKDEFCDTVESTMRLGFSKLAAAGRIGVDYDTLKRWMGIHPAFYAAVKRGEAARCEKLEQDLLDAETGPKVTSRIFALKNAAPDEWKDRVVNEHSGPDGGPMEISGNDAFARVANALGKAHAAPASSAGGEGDMDGDSPPGASDA